VKFRFFGTAASVAAVSFVFVSPACAAAAAPPSKLDVPLVLTDGLKVVKRTRREMGFTLAAPTGPVSFRVDRGRLKDALQRISPQFNVEAQPARPVAYKGAVRIRRERYGRKMNVPTTAEMIAQAVTKNPATTRFNVSVTKAPPALVAAKLKGINGVLGRATTPTSANAKRNHNIALAVGFIDATLLSPGETFSLNGEVGKRTQARGFRTAPVFVNAEKVPGIGGGVSQVTGTLFNAAAKAGLKITEVHPHSRPVAYLPLGFDATVDYGVTDLKFTNDTQAPVFVEYKFNAKQGRLTATLYGRRVPGKVVRLKANVQRLGPGKIDSQLYRIIKKNGQVATKERLFDHQYRWDPKSKG
jgi:vancomycin resistance protein YoaR